MNRKFSGISATLVSLFLMQAARGQAAPDLAAGFQSPPESAKPHTWWHWMNGNISKPGITADLEAMKRVGLGGAHLAMVGAAIPQGPVAYDSPEMIDDIRFAIHEATRLDMDLCMFNCPGWSSSGGPWITPDQSMKVLAYTETTAGGGKKIQVALSQPTAQQSFYKDSMVVAFPTPASDVRVPNFNNGLGRGGGGARGRGPAPVPTLDAPGIDPAQVVDLTKNMDANGQLTWDAPPPPGSANWTIVRIGFTTNGTQNRPAPDGGFGLEVDKFSKEALDFHFNTFYGKFFDDMKPLVAKGKMAGLIDSYETGAQNWTDQFPQEFLKRRGYSMLPFMPAMIGGRVVGTADQTERFLWDVRKTQAELMDENYYDHFTELCHAHGMKSFIEPYDTVNFDEMTAGANIDMPMGEFWQGQANQHSIKQVASIAHLNGRPVMGAESFTSQSRWTEYPYALKALGDFMWTQGLNKFVFHRFAHQPNTQDVVPGMTMGPWGGHFDRTNTWFEESTSWLKYCARSQFLLQQGLFVGDLVYFTGEDSPVKSPDEARLDPAPPPGHGYDLIDTGTMKKRVKIVDGKITLPDGLTYRAFVLPATVQTMTVEMMQNLHDLVEAGMCLVVNGPAPVKTPSLTGFPRGDGEVARLAGDLWGDLNGKSVTEHVFGKGRVFWGEPLKTVLEEKLAAKADFQWSARSGNADINYIHKHVGETEIYFVANRGQRSEDIVCTFNTAGKQPELWDADSATITPAVLFDVVEGRTRLPLYLDPSGSIFVVFRKTSATPMLHQVTKDGAVLMTATAFENRQLPAATLPNQSRSGQLPMALPAAEDPPALELASPGQPGPLAWQNGVYAFTGNPTRVTVPITVADIAAPYEIPGPWQVTFPPKRGAPATATFDKLASWSNNTDAGITYFSGTATYTNHFTVTAEQLAKDNRLFLDLGRVLVVAEVIVNGKNLGVLWKLPFRTDISGAVKTGDNTLEIRITNLWPNRLIGDEQKPAENAYMAQGARGTPAQAQLRPGSILQIPDWYANNLPKPESPRITFTTWQHWKATDALLESGLIGPVTLRAAQRVNIAQ